ncbi:hypothetical protein CISIN_1g036820mg [Citrus sinensis]|uniref:MAR-binding filament-like protein 1-1 n=1 Tax=Citrus sinensis TaxID=2711 RepID=A0A067E7P3_CITSI|nr:hypothetical protein CISIN_1g036820mg [Citrus sinensis]
MDLVMGSSSFKQPLLHFPSSSSSFYSQSSLLLCTNNARTKRRNRLSAMASMRPGDPKDNIFTRRKTILLVGISVLPLLNLRARALDGLAPRSGVLGALYALTQNEKKATDATLEYMKARLKEKEAAIVSLEKDFESKLQNEQEQRTKQLKSAKEEQQLLMNKLNSANTTISGLGKELQNEKRFIEELRIEIDSLQTSLLKFGEDKRTLEEERKQKLDRIEGLQDKINLLSLELREKDDGVQKLSSSLQQKETELKNLNSVYKQNELNARASSLLVERDDSKQKLEAVQKEYKELKLSSENETASNAKRLREKKEELHQLKEKLELTLDEACENRATIAKFTQEKDDLRKMLDNELGNVKNLKYELQITQETLETTRNEASDLEKQLKQSKDSCADLETEISRIRAEFAEVKHTLGNSLDEAKRSGEVLAGELFAAKEVLKKASEELQNVSHELEATAENRDSLRKELVNIYKKAEATANDLKEQKEIVSSLNKELQALEKQTSKDKEARKSLETDLEEATKSLDEMNRNALELSKNLEKANSQISNLEDEKAVLYKSLTEQKSIANESRENMEDAHNLVMRLGQERKSLDKRSKKLEEELASAKGEILRLRSQINSSKTLVNDENPRKVEDDNKVPVTAKKTTRRRKSNSQ